MLTIILEAALRSSLLALAVWAGIRVFRVHLVLAQKLAWVLVLLAAVVMPVVMRAPFLALNRAIQIPLRKIPLTGIENYIEAAVLTSQPLGAHAANGAVRKQLASVEVPIQAMKPKPTAAHRISIADSAVINIRSSRDRLEQFSVSLNPKPGGDDSEGVAVLNLLPTRKSNTSLSPILTRAAHNRVSNRLGLPTWTSLRSVFSWLYFGVGSLILIRMLMALGLAYRLWSRAKPFAAEGLPDGQHFLGSGKEIHIRISPDLSSPVTIGSTILLPISYSEWGVEKVRVVLAHEQSHVRQRDFYLQLAASIHAAVFWFSPLGWWLRRKLSELGEALGDHAGLEEAESPASYARILLEFAAMPHKPIAGVAMARTSNLSSRIDRILSDRRSRLAFLSNRKHAWLAAVLVPAALVAVVACIRVVPGVEAAQDKLVIVGPGGQQSQQPADQAAAADSAQVSGAAQGTASNSASGTSNALSNSESTRVEELNGESSSNSAHVVELTTSDDSVQASDLTTSPKVVSPPAPPLPPLTGVASPTAPDAPEPLEEDGPEAPAAPKHRHGFAYLNSGGDGEDSFAIVQGNDNNVYTGGRNGQALEEAKKKYHNNFIWFERDGKSYVITDPAIVAQSEAMFKADPRLELRQQELQKLQSKLDEEMKNLKPEIDKASLPGPEFQEEMKKLNAELAELQTDKLKKMAEDIAKEVQSSQKITQEEIQQLTQEKLGNLQEKMGEIQGQIGEIQGRIGERQGLLGEKQGEIGERMGKIGERMGQIGEEEGRKAEESVRKMKSVIDQAVKDGKAKPVE